MNATNRVVNRLFLVVSAVVVLLVGGALMALAVVPETRDGWRPTVERTASAITDAAAAVSVGDTGASWLPIAAVAALAILAALVIVMLARLGGGGARTILDAPSDRGGVTFAPAVAAGSLRPAIESSPDIASVSVRAYVVRGTPALSIHATCRRGVSPRDVVETVQARTAAFEALLGQERTTVIQLSGGHRPARSTH